jgi:iron(III) transport system ATP-binding protein
VSTDQGLELEAVCPPPVHGTLAPGTPVEIRIPVAAVLVLPDEVQEPSRAVAA